MKKSIGTFLVGSLLLTGVGQAEADWVKDPQGKWEFYSNEVSISNFYSGKSNDFVKPVKLPQYYQADARWSYKRYGMSNMKATGCVPTVLSMVISGLKENVTPVQVADFIYDTSLEMNTVFSGTSSLGAEAALGHWGFNYRIINSRDDLEIALKNGNSVYATVGHGIFVKGYSTHAIVLSGYQNGKTHAVDPDNPERTNKWYNVDDIWNQRSQAPEDNVTGGAFIAIYK